MARLPYRYCLKNVSGYRLFLLIQQKLRIVHYWYGSLSVKTISEHRLC